MLKVWGPDSPVLIEGPCPVTQRGWVGEEPQRYHRVLLIRSGACLRRLNGVETFVDSTSVAIVRPGDEMQVAHPLGCNDQITILQFTAADAYEWELRAGDFTLGDDLDMAHRRLVSRARRGTDDLELGERIGTIFDRLPREREREIGALRPSHRRLAAQASELLLTEAFGLGLDGIAKRLNCSPHHLSRVFRNATGQTLTAYRNRARVRHVLTDLEEGERRLSDLSARYGFVDQAHMIRVVRRYAGDSPGTLRKMLRA